MPGIKDKLEELLSTTSVKIGNDAIQKAVETQRAKQAEAASAAVVEVLENAQRVLGMAVCNLRCLRKKEKLCRDAVTNLDRAIAYFKATGNPLPLSRHGVNINEILNVLGMYNCQHDEKDYVIPTDWVAPE